MNNLIFKDLELRVINENFKFRFCCHPNKLVVPVTKFQDAKNKTKN